MLECSLPNRVRALIAPMILLLMAPGGAAELPLLRSENFDSGGLTGWKFSDRAAWKLVEHEKGKALALFQQSKYVPKVRSPINYAMIDSLSVTDFVLDVKLKSTVRDYAHRDLCLFFGYQDPEHFYYIHLGRKADAHAHSVFLVDGKPRVSIAKERTDGAAWTDGWHRARVERNSATGEIVVYFGDMKKPIMRAIDKTFTWGKVGVGSFDDTGEFDDVVLWGRKR